MSIGQLIFIIYIISEVLYWCPELFGDAYIGSREEIEEHIRNYLKSECEINLNEAAVLCLVRGIDQSKLPTNRPVADLPPISEFREKRRNNIIRILNNIINNPGNPVYRRLRARNELIKDLLSIDGFELFLKVNNFLKN